MRNTNQHNHSPFDELANEMLLAIFNARSEDTNFILEPKDIAAVSLSCRNFNQVSQGANCIFFPHTYKELRNKAFDYHNYKEKQLARLKYEQKVHNEKNGSLYWNKNFRNGVACVLSLLFASLLAFKFDMNFATFFLTHFVLGIVTTVISELAFYHLEPAIDADQLRKIPLQFLEEEIVNKSVAFNLK